jgi:hypothetical protein
MTSAPNLARDDDVYGIEVELVTAGDSGLTTFRLAPDCAALVQGKPTTNDPLRLAPARATLAQGRPSTHA